MNKQDSSNVAPWYKQPWLWFILAPLIAVFIYSLVFIYLSIKTADGVVKDDYFKVARGIELNSDKQNKAADLALAATLRLDMMTGSVSLLLEGKFEQLPTNLKLDIVHPTHQKYDQIVMLRNQQGSNQYIGNLAEISSGKRFIIVSPEDDSWSLRTEVAPPYEGEPVKFSAN